MNTLFESVLVALSTAAIFTGCIDDPAGPSAAASPDDIVATAPVVGPAHVFASQHADALVASRPDFLHASPSDAFARTSVMPSGGLSYVAYERTHRGLPVIGGDFVLVVDDAGQIAYQSVAQERTIDLPSVTPTLSQVGAESIAARQLLSLTRVEEGTRLVVNALGDTPRLAWESTVEGSGANGISRLTVDVDAITGAVLSEQEHVLQGTGTGLWNGPSPLPLNTTRSGNTFQMRDPIITNLSCRDAANGTIFSGPDDVWGNGNGTNRETGCVDALFVAQTEARMLTQWLGRNAMDGVGGAFPIQVGLNQESAFYDGRQVMVGHNSVNQWIGALDVVGHEMGHSIDDHTPGGISRGGTQEFVGDTFGVSTEWFADQSPPFDGPDFSVGDSINLHGDGEHRNMANPSLVGHPNCFSSSIPSIEVHAAAGPGNHWFYLVAEGSNPTNGQPTSPTCNGATVAGGLGVKTTMQIMYSAMLMKTTASSYLTYRTWTLQAAKNLFPDRCTEFDAVKAAWDAVSVPAQRGDPTCSVTTPGCINGAFNATDVPRAIPDNNATGITSILPVTGNGNVGTLSLSLNITHRFRGNLVVTLVAPDGTPFVVSNRQGGSADNIVINNMAITTFNGRAAAGNWQLQVQDRAAANVGTLNSWSLNLVGNCGTAVN